MHDSSEAHIDITGKAAPHLEARDQTSVFVTGAGLTGSATANVRISSEPDATIAGVSRSGVD
jgi:hypothetical protein